MPHINTHQGIVKRPCPPCGTAASRGRPVACHLDLEVDLNEFADTRWLEITTGREHRLPSGSLSLVKSRNHRRLAGN